MESTNTSSSALNVDRTTLPCLRAIKSTRFALPLLLMGLDSQSSSNIATASPRDANPIGSSSCALNAAPVNYTSLRGCLKMIDVNLHLCRFMCPITKIRRLQIIIIGACARVCEACTRTASSALVSTVQATTPNTDLYAS